MPNKNIALEKIESHEKLCRIMQKQTHGRINQLQNQEHSKSERFSVKHCIDF